MHTYKHLHMHGYACMCTHTHKLCGLGILYVSSHGSGFLLFISSFKLPCVVDALIPISCMRKCKQRAQNPAAAAAAELQGGPGGLDPESVLSRASSKASFLRKKTFFLACCQSVGGHGRVGREITAFVSAPCWSGVPGLLSDILLVRSAWPSLGSFLARS